MTIKVVLIILALHYIGDFLCQSRKMATSKSKSWYWLGKHCLIVWCLLALTPVPNPLIFATVNALAHGGIDKLIWLRYNRYVKTRGTGFHWFNDYWFYSIIGFDQLLHVGILMATARFMQ